jgi:hypothetical protein
VLCDDLRRKNFQDNAEYAFLQMDDRVLVYRGADQPDMSVINPESDVWQHIKACTLSHLKYSDTTQMQFPDTAKISGNKLADTLLCDQR